jgi:hypothetical protein
MALFPSLLSVLDIVIFTMAIEESIVRIFQIFNKMDSYIHSGCKTKRVAGQPAPFLKSVPPEYASRLRRLRVS